MAAPFFGGSPAYSRTRESVCLRSIITVQMLSATVLYILSTIMYIIYHLDIRLSTEKTDIRNKYAFEVAL